MIHLFNKIYLKPVHFLTQTEKRILLTPEHVLKIRFENHSTNQLTGQYPDVPILAASSYEALIGEFGGEHHSFLQALMVWPASERLTIEASVSDIFHLQAKWLKTIYSHWSHAEYRQYMDFHILRWKALQALGQRSLTDPWKLSFRDDQLHDLQVCIQEQALNDRWETTQPWVITAQDHNALLANASLELQIPTLLVNPQWPHAEQVKAKLVGLVKRALYMEFSEHVIVNIKRNFYNFKLMEPEAEFDFFQHSLYDVAVAHREYRFLADQRFTLVELLNENVNPHPQGSIFEYLETTYGLSDLQGVFTKAAQWFPIINHQLAPLFKNDLTFEDILENGHLIFEHGRYQDNINAHLLALTLDKNPVNPNATAARERILRTLELKLR